MLVTFMIASNKHMYKYIFFDYCKVIMNFYVMNLTIFLFNTKPPIIFSRSQKPLGYY